MNKNKGFTLIELLVVIAIIGILSSVVLASLSGARTKAKIAAVQSTLSSMRAQAEIGVVNGRYIPNLCASTSQGGLGSLMLSLANKTSKITSLECGVDAADAATEARKWAAEVQIDSKWYCADSSGFAGQITAPSIGATVVDTFTTPATAYTTTYGVTDLSCVN
jgi:type IV pilus assembly protein PilA